MSTTRHANTLICEIKVIPSQMQRLTVTLKTALAEDVHERPCISGSEQVCRRASECLAH
jgi:hypothetical protein